MLAVCNNYFFYLILIYILPIVLKIIYNTSDIKMLK